MESKLLECVPNFSEGCDKETLSSISEAITSVDGVTLLNIDPGKAANRTVFTFIGAPDTIVEAAFRATKKAKELIDMSKHKGEHPRIGATDVMPLIPLCGVTMKETVEYARKLSKRVGEELNIPVYCYEEAAFGEHKRNLAHCRDGEYEGIKDKIKSELWKPDFGPTTYTKDVEKSGISVIGAREFLLAVNFNLNTDSEAIAKDIALDIREKGRFLRDEKGEKILDKDGKPQIIKGTLKGVKAIGWYIKEYGVAQVSTNVTDSKTVNLHSVFEKVSSEAQKRGYKVTGTEIIGLVQKRHLVEAGLHYLKTQKLDIPTQEDKIIDLGIKFLGLNDLCEFKKGEKIIEYMM